MQQWGGSVEVRFGKSAGGRGTVCSELQSLGRQELWLQQVVALSWWGWGWGVMLSTAQNAHTVVCSVPMYTSLDNTSLFQTMLFPAEERRTHAACVKTTELSGVWNNESAVYVTHL